jgi:exodeoxyribonuclease VII small subunit
LGQPTEKISFEEALEQLEQVVRDLEEGDADLDASLALFEDGVKLSRHCLQALDDARGRILKLVQGPDGQPALKLLDTDTEP